ncbi:MAG: hypothetical protein ACKV19_16830 [Verrucomicrobiales bacterium]
MGLFLSVAALVAQALGAIVPGAEPKKWPSSPEKHKVVITRQATDDADRRLIKAAENAQPLRRDVQQAAGETKLPTTGPLWWYKEELGVRIPFAATSDAVSYFRDLVTRYGKESFTRYTEPSSHLEYAAKVVAHDSFTHDKESFVNVRVVTLKLDFSQNFCATGTEGLSFQKERLVIFNAAGRIIRIFGDGPTETPILAI